jgi:predicted amidohydrolase
MCAFGNPLAPVAQSLDGPWATAVRKLAAEHQLTAVVGMFTPADEGRVANTLLVTGPDTDDHYDKIHLFDAFGYRESDTVAAGDRTVVVQIAGVNVGLATCYDLRFPALFTRLAQAGADLVVLPASWGAGPGKTEQWQLLTRARAVDATVFVAACDQGRPPAAVARAAGTAPTGIGHSVLVSPWGTVVAEAAEETTLLVREVDLDQVAAARAAIPVLANARL